VTHKEERLVYIVHATCNSLEIRVVNWKGKNVSH
jgi:hypothetical protein